MPGIINAGSNALVTCIQLFHFYHSIADFYHIYVHHRYSYNNGGLRDCLTLISFFVSHESPSLPPRRAYETSCAQKYLWVKRPWVLTIMLCTRIRQHGSMS